MALVPQGLVFWGGVDDFVSAHMTLTPGISPSTCTLTIPPQDLGKIFKAGPLAFRYGGASWTLQGCRMDSIAPRVASNGAEVWLLTIQDRRWVWQECGRISGFYNVRIGDTLRKDTEKTPHELADLCFEAMGETGYSLDGLPDDTRPEVDWDYTKPAEALAQLCDSLGCVIVLGLDDKVSIHRKAEGQPLPDLPAIEGSALFDPPDPPEKLVIAGARTRFQIDLELEPVAKEKDGTIVPIDDVSYRPKDGWEYFADVWNFTGLDDAKLARLAAKYVWRLYRIKTPIELPGDFPDVEDLWRILPLENKQIEHWKSEEENEEDIETEPRPPWVYGKFDPGLGGDKPLTDDQEPNLDQYPEGFYYGGFSLQADKGIVEFREPVVLTDIDPVNFLTRIKPPEIFLRVAFSVRDPDTGGWIRQEVEDTPPAESPIPGQKQYITQDDVVREIYTKTDPGPEETVDNLKEVEKRAQYYLDAAMIAFTPKQSASISYPGFVRIEPDGAITQVTWSVDSQGRATTRASRNREEPMVAPSYDEMRFLQRLQRELREKAKPERLREVDREKRGAVR